MSAPGVVSEAERFAAAEHAAEIMFDGTAVFEDGCVLCEAAIRLGIWEGYGYSEVEMRGPDAQASEAEEAAIDAQDGV